MQTLSVSPAIFDWANYGSTSKYNERVSMSDYDRKLGAKILCKESYAQELYNLYTGHDGALTATAKDFSQGQLCTVLAKSIDFENKVIITEEKFSKSTILSGSVTFMVCNSTMCLPPKDIPFKISLDK